MAGTDDAEVPFRELVDCEGAAVRADADTGLVQADTIESSLFSCGVTGLWRGLGAELDSKGCALIDPVAGRVRFHGEMVSPVV